MKTYNSIALAGVAMAALSACGGASTTPTPMPISLPAATFSEGGTPIMYDPAAGTLSVDGNAVVSPRGTALVTNGDATVYRSAIPTHFSSISQNGDAFAVASSSVTGADPRAFTYGRRGATELPTTGMATFSGDYVGQFVDDGAQTVFGLVDGDVMLAADMANMTLTGDITNRVAYTSTGALAAAPIAFADAQIIGGTIAADGSFDATVTGGVRTISAGDYNYVSGTANGTFAGATGGTAAGVVEIMQTRPTTLIPRSEIGSFIATRN